MSVSKPEEKEKPFAAEIAKQGRAICKKCKQKCLQGELRIAKLVPNPFDNGSAKMKTWHHLNCIFEVFAKQRQTTRRIESHNDIEGWDSLCESDKEAIAKKIVECKRNFDAKFSGKTSNSKTKATANKTQEDFFSASSTCSVRDDFQKDTSNSKTKATVNKTQEDIFSASSTCSVRDDFQKDNLFREFRRIVSYVSSMNSSNEKISIFREIFSKGSDGSGFKGDKLLWCKLLLPSVVKKVFHLQTKQLIKIFSRMFEVSQEVISGHLDQGDIGQTVQHFFEQSKKFKPAKTSTLTIFEVDDFLSKLSELTKEDDQYNLFITFARKCTANDLKVVVRLIKHDLKMSAGAKHVFQGLHPDAYQTFQNCRSIEIVLETCFTRETKGDLSIKLESHNKTPNKRRKRSDNSSLKAEKNTARKKSTTSPTSRKRKVPSSDDVFEDLKPPTPTILEVDCGLKCDDVALDSRTSIPNYFENVTLLLEDGVAEKHAEWLRYFIAYGGTIWKPDVCGEATHVLHLKDCVSEQFIQCAPSARHVIIEWIKDTVSKKCLQDFRPYTVRLIPN